MLKIVCFSASILCTLLTTKILFSCIKTFSTYSREKKDKYFYKVLFFPDEEICNGKRSKILKPNNNNNNVVAKEENNNDPFTNISIPINIRRNFSNCRDDNSPLLYLLKFIISAKTNLDVCLLIFTLDELAAAVINAKKRGVKVRVIVDSTMSECSGSSLPCLQKENIPVLRGPPNMMLHHKFVLVDANGEGNCGMVATGSFNWTWGAVTSNYENVMVTNNPELVQPFKCEFDRLWSLFFNRKKKKMYGKFF